MSRNVVLSGAGLWTPEHTISNEELVASYNAYAIKFNEENAADIESGTAQTKPQSSAEFIEKASGIKSRFAYVKDGILDVDRMRARIPYREEEALSHQAEMGVNAANIALADAGLKGHDIDMVIVSCAYTQRSYPAIAIEIQNELGITGSGFDMLVACSSATFGMHRAYDAIAAGSANRVLVINPELTSPQVNYCDRDSHFIFGDVSTAVILEAQERSTSANQYKILGLKAATYYSSNIRSNFGYISYADDSDPYAPDKMFHQNGRKVFKEVCPLVPVHLHEQVAACDLEVTGVRRWWLHQANINMNHLIARKLLGRDPVENEAPIVLDQYANTASAGSVIAFCKHRDDLLSGDIGVLCSFGGGYSIGSLVIQKV